MMFPAPIARRLTRILIMGLCLVGCERVTAAGLGTSGQSLGGARGVTSGTGEPGLGLGNFSPLPFRITLQVQGGYDDNVFTTGIAQQGSAFTNGTLALSYEFGSPRTQIDLRTGGGITYYWDRPQQPGPDYNAFLALNLTHKFTERMSLDFTSYTTYQTEPDFSLNIGVLRRSGSYFYTSDNFKFTYLFSPRFSTATSYVITSVDYGSNSSTGVFENRLENTIGNEFRYLMLPTTTLVGEYRIKFTTYLDADAEAMTQYLLAGFDHTFNPRLNATARVGAEVREFDQGGGTEKNGETISPHIETTVTYAFGERSNVIWTNSYGIQEGNSTSSKGRTTYHTGLTLKYGVTPRITTQLALFYQHSGGDQGNNSDGNNQDGIDAALSVRYAVTRYLGLQAGYNYTEVSSDIFGRAYSRNRIYAGFDFIF